MPRILQQYLEIALLDQELSQAGGDFSVLIQDSVKDHSTWSRNTDDKMNSAQHSFGSFCSYATEMAFLKARINNSSILYTACLDPGQYQPQLPDWVMKNLNDGFHAAELLIEIAIKAAAETPLWSTGVRLAIYKAVFFLIKLSVSPWRVGSSTRAREAIRKTWDVLHNASRQKHDQYDRVCSVIEYMSTGGIDTDGFAGSMRVKGRMASNIVYDTIFCAKERFDKSVRDANPVDLVEAAENAKVLDETARTFADMDWDTLFDFPSLEPGDSSMV